MYKPTVLLVDDRSEMRQLIRLALGQKFEILEAENGARALHITHRNRPALVVLDITMPGKIDGLQVLDAIKADPQLIQTRVIMVTARGQAADYDEGMERGADAYFVKPFSPMKLANFITEMLPA